MTYGSVCSGIEAATVAWHPLGWKPAWFAETDPFCSALLKKRYSKVHNYGDFTKIGADAPAIDVLVGGTPCQPFSVAGFRAGLDDARGNLALEFCRLADRLRTRWIVWENVPGVLSSNRGRDFGAILGAMGELGYGTAYRVLDAQFFGVPQRRRRLFLIGHSGDWRRAAAVLFERQSLSGYPPPSRETGEEAPPEIAHGTGAEITAVPILETGARTGKSTDDIRAGCGIGEAGDPMFTLQPGKQHGVFASTGETAHCLNAGGMGRIDYESETLITTSSVFRKAMRPHNAEEAERWEEDAIAGTLNGWDERRDIPGHLIANSAVRRLTPLECERLQGFPDGYTDITYRGKPAADSPRYRALGNSMAVPCMAWIGERIQEVSTK